VNSSRESEENELKLVATVETQAKMLASIKGKGTGEPEVKEILVVVMAVLHLADFVVSKEHVGPIIDEYFDTADFAVYKTHAALRVRRSQNKIEVTIKKIRDIEQGLFSRQEITEEITEQKYAELVRTGFRDKAIVSFPELQDQRFLLVLRVDNERRSFALKRRDEEYALALDLFTYKNPRIEDASEIQSELEIEALNDPAKGKLSSIRRDFVEIVKGFRLSTDSKYERGVKYFNLDRPTWLRWIQEHVTTNKGLAWIGIILAVLGIILTIIFR
jgi:inorganic triphosphatase YgiF